MAVINVEEKDIRGVEEKLVTIKNEHGEINFSPSKLNAFFETFLKIALSKTYPVGDFGDANLKWLTEQVKQAGEIDDELVLKLYKSYVDNGVLPLLFNNKFEERYGFYLLMSKNVIATDLASYLKGDLTIEDISKLAKYAKVNNIIYDTINAIDDKVTELGGTDVVNTNSDLGASLMTDEELDAKVGEIANGGAETIALLDDPGIQEALKESEEILKEAKAEAEADTNYDPLLGRKIHTGGGSTTTDNVVGGVLIGTGAIALCAAAYFGYQCFFADGCSGDDDIVLVD